MVTIVSAAVTAAFAATLNGASATNDPLRPSFSHLDRDGDDAISVDELRTLINEEFDLPKYLNDESIKSVFNTLDINKDQHIGYDEAMRLYVSLAMDSMFQGLLSEVDEDRNHKISLQEVKETLKPISG